MEVPAGDAASGQCGTRATRAWERAQRVAGALLLFTVAACASLPDRTTVAPTPSTAIDAPLHTRLAATAGAAVDRSGFASAFRPLLDGPEAYQTLLELAREATRSIDVQTFVLHGDRSGALLLKALREAAARGVRIRVLVDDLHSDSAESLLSDFAAFDNVEVRLVNPFTRLRGSVALKLLSSLDEIGRVNHRMHNKQFIADNLLAVFGGRNIGDRYHAGNAPGLNFIDLDLLAAGAAVRQMSASFDAYWNSEFAWPIDSIVVPRGSRRARQQGFDESLSRFISDAKIHEGPARASSTPEDLRRGVLVLTGADAEVIADPPEKLGGTNVGDRAGTVRAAIGVAGLATKSEVIMVSPYYIPGSIGIVSLRTNHREGVRLELFTNSLASTDVPAVHAGYTLYRRELIDLGTKIYELSPTLAARQRGLDPSEGLFASLHAKVIFFDRTSTFVGSMNLDGRSEQYNTEVGIMIRDPEFTARILSMMERELKPASYRVTLDSEGRLRWTDPAGQVEYRNEPEASDARMLGVGLIGELIPDDWL